jgi:hypothetical protein
MRSTCHPISVRDALERACYFTSRLVEWLLPIPRKLERVKALEFLKVWICRVSSVWPSLLTASAFSGVGFKLIAPSRLNRYPIGYPG